MTNTQKSIAVQRLTALWAFGESGLGGMLHALHVPFTGLVAGSLSVICICMIGSFSGGKQVRILRSLVLVLIVKAVVSPQTPFPAYIAVAFQGMLGYLIFSTAGISFISILFLSVITMIESAMQKLLLLSLFFGRTLWEGLDELVIFIMKPFGITVSGGSWWIAGIYLFIYIAGGVFTALIAKRLIAYNFSAGVSPFEVDQDADNVIPLKRRSGGTKKMLILLAFFSMLLLLLPANDYTETLRAVTWTVTAVFSWYLFISPLVTGFVRKRLAGSGRQYQAEAEEIISFLPSIRSISIKAWQLSGRERPARKIPVFLLRMITMVITSQHGSLNR